MLIYIKLVQIVRSSLMVDGAGRGAGGCSFTKQLSKHLGLSSFLLEKFTLIPYHKILRLNLR